MRDWYRAGRHDVRPLPERHALGATASGRVGVSLGLARKVFATPREDVWWPSRDELVWVGCCDSTRKIALEDDMNNTGSTIAITIGIISFCGAVANYAKSPDGNVGPINLGLYLVLGGLAFRSSKHRRINKESARSVRILIELLLISAVAFLVFGGGREFFYKELAEEPVPVLVGIGSIVFWVVSCFLPRLQVQAEQQRTDVVSNGTVETHPLGAKSKLLVRPGVYCAEGIEFRMYSSGRILVSKSDLKPLDDAGTDFQSIGWFLRAYPDIDMNGIRRIGD